MIKVFKIVSVLWLAVVFICFIISVIKHFPTATINLHMRNFIIIAVMSAAILNITVTF